MHKELSNLNRLVRLHCSFYRVMQFAQRRRLLVNLLKKLHRCNSILMVSWRNRLSWSLLAAAQLGCPFRGAPDFSQIGGGVAPSGKWTRLSGDYVCLNDKPLGDCAAFAFHHKVSLRYRGSPASRCLDSINVNSSYFAARSERRRQILDTVGRGWKVYLVALIDSCRVW